MPGSDDTRPPSAPRLLEISHVTFRWPGRGAFAIEVPDFAMSRGERVLLVGPSGSGKSTLLALIAGIVAPSAGQARILGEDLARLRSSARDRFRAEHMGVIFQMFNLLPYASAVDNVLLPLSFAPRRRARLGAGPAQAARALELLDRLGLDTATHASRRAAELSVGQQQRVAAARALIGAPELIVADEPTSALDPEVRDQFLELMLGEVETSGAGLLMVSHDPALAPHFDRIVRLADIVRATAPEVVP